MKEDPRGISREVPVFMEGRAWDPEDDFFRSIVDHTILEAVEALPDEFRIVVILSDLEDFSYEEISEVLEIPLGTVKSRLFRGRKLLQEALVEYATEMGYVSPSKDSPESEA